MDSKFQEFARIIEATLAELNPEGANNGQNGLATIIYLRSILDKKLSPDFVKYMNGCNFAVDVPEVIEKIYLYPETKRSIAHVVITPPAMLEQARLLFESKIFVPMISNNAIYFSTMDGTNLIPELFNIFKPRNYTHYPRITGLVVAGIDSTKIGKNKISDYILKTKPMFRISSGRAVVRDVNEFGLYSEVMGVEIKSDELLAWLAEFYKQFNPSLSVPDLIFTFAIKDRRLQL
jgi:hypothetical protein